MGLDVRRRHWGQTTIWQRETMVGIMVEPVRDQQEIDERRFFEGFEEGALGIGRVGADDEDARLLSLGAVEVTVDLANLSMHEGADWGDGVDVDGLPPGLQEGSRTTVSCSSAAANFSAPDLPTPLGP
jgi:hypothetical protein